MPKKAKELSAMSVAKIKENGRHAVGGVDGLHLRIVDGSRAWVLRVVVGQRANEYGALKNHRRDIGLGSYPEVSLAEAREKARELKKQIRDSIDPLQEKQERLNALRIKKQREKTFRECAEIVFANKAREVSNQKHATQWASTVTTYVFPILGDRIIGSITKSDIASVLESIWIEKNETAKRIRGRLENIFDYAKAMEYFVGDNPAAWKGNLEPILGNLKREVKSLPSLPYASVSKFMEHLQTKGGIAARALEFTILTACRSGEIFGAKWSEINFDSKVWIIPKERMKAKKEHQVPLSDEALGILKALHINTNLDDHIFIAPKGGMLSDMSITAVIRRMHAEQLEKDGIGYIDPKQNRVITTHGFRSTFRDWSADKTEYPREVCEHVLAHKLPDEVEAAYLRGAYLEKRKGLMSEWAKFCFRNTT
ncbi:tyrosine-type recombinase/integrase [Acinetobacter modestus]|uniref:tyrosine-type recombinase/integrase n=1 Tax=Acinetobacter modestus TaxID=1776740 RepID=UPI00320A4842